MRDGFASFSAVYFFPVCKSARSLTTGALYRRWYVSGGLDEAAVVVRSGLVVLATLLLGLLVRLMLGVALLRDALGRVGVVLGNVLALLALELAIEASLALRSLAALAFGAVAASGTVVLVALARKALAFRTLPIEALAGGALVVAIAVASACGGAVAL